MKKILKKIKLPLFFTTLSGTTKLIIGMAAGILVVMGVAFALAKSIPQSKQTDVASGESTFDPSEYVLQTEVQTETVTKTTKRAGAGNVEIVELVKPEYTAPAYVPTTRNTSSSGTEIPDYMPSSQKQGSGTTVDTASKSSYTSSENRSSSSAASSAQTTPSTPKQSTPVNTSPGSSADKTASHTHSYAKEITRKATCTETGQYTFRCSCGASYTEEIAKLGHTWGRWVTSKEPTCAAKGKEKRTCSVCNKEETREIDKIAHTWGEYEVTTAATCAKEGVKTRICSVCKEKQTASIAKVAHTWGDVNVTVAPTCYSEGSGTHTCTVCGTNEKVKLIKIDHTWKEWVVDTAPTCEETGYRHHICEICKEVEGEETKALGHNWTNWNVYPAGCETDGYRERSCQRCGAHEEETITATGHSEREAVQENYTAATCTTPGSFDSVVYCDNCNEELSRTTVELAALGHHFIDEVCVRCGESHSAPGDGT